MRTLSMTAAARVLVVDDCEDTATSMAMLLEAWGMEAVVARDGRSALNLARRYRPDVVLLDLGLPDMNGAEVARELRGSAQFDRTMIIAISGYSSLTDRGRSQGCQRHFVKPVNLELLHAMLQQGLKQFREEETKA